MERVGPAEVARPRRTAMSRRGVGRRASARPLAGRVHAAAGAGDMHQPRAEQVGVVDVRPAARVVARSIPPARPTAPRAPNVRPRARGRADSACPVTAPASRSPLAAKAVDDHVGGAGRIEAPAGLHVPWVAPCARPGRAIGVEQFERRAGRARGARRRRVRRCARTPTDPKIPSAFGISGWRRRYSRRTSTGERACSWMSACRRRRPPTSDRRPSPPQARRRDRARGSRAALRTL